MTENHLTLESLRALPLPVPKEGSKEQRGTVLVLGGSVEVPGAAFLAGVAALRAGAGRLRIATVRSVATSMALVVPEARVVGLAETEDGEIDPAQAEERVCAFAERCDAVLVGPGLSACEATNALSFSLLLAQPWTSFVLDAGAICGLAAGLVTLAGRLAW